MGDDGIIQKAKEQAEATRRASAEEDMNRLVLEYQLAKSDETLESFLQEKVTEGRIDGVTDNGDGTITITKKVEGKDYTITVKKPVAPTPSVKVGAIRVVSDSTGAGSSLGEASTRCIVPICTHEILLNEDLLLYGLAVLYEKNR